MCCLVDHTLCLYLFCVIVCLLCCIRRKSCSGPSVVHVKWTTSGIDSSKIDLGLSHSTPPLSGIPETTRSVGVNYYGMSRKVVAIMSRIVFCRFLQGTQSFEEKNTALTILWCIRSKMLHFLQVAHQ